MTNEQIADALEQLADMLEFQGDNPFRLRALRNGARVVRELPDEAADLIARGVDLTQFEGIGEGVAKKCVDLVQNGRLKQLDEIFAKVPPSVLDLLRIPKLGPKKAAALHKALGITSLDELQRACDAHEIQTLPGFGAKTESAILEGIQLVRQSSGRMLWSRADHIARQLTDFLSSRAQVNQLAVAGSYRRLRETVGDLDVLVDADDPNRVMDSLAQFPDIDAVVARGPTKMTIRLREAGLQVDLRTVPPESFGAALVYFTGSKQHNIEIRSRAKKLGLKVNEWGVFQDHDHEQYLAGKSEMEVYESLGLVWIPPELREARHELEWAEHRTLPQLIEVTDIAGDLHTHTSATDGAATIEEMAAAARRRGLKYLAITDHSQRVAMARGLDPTRARSQWAMIDLLNRNRSDDFLILKGIECDILEDGKMDLPDDVLAEADWVVASIHYGQNQPRAQITDRLIRAISNPHVHVIGHPTGRLLNRRKPYEFELESVFQAAREHLTFLELNANPHRLDLSDVHLIAAKSYGIKIVISTDAHHVDDLDNLRYGINQARRAALTADDIGNTRSWEELQSLMDQ